MATKLLPVLVLDTTELVNSSGEFIGSELMTYSGVAVMSPSGTR